MSEQAPNTPPANTASFKDARGRKIEIRKLKPLDRMRLVELVGSDNANNDRYLGYATLAYCVNSIDDQPVGIPSNKVGLEGIVKELDDDGIDAVAQGIKKYFLPTESNEDALKNA